jgi:VWFA-related protein
MFAESRSALVVFVLAGTLTSVPASAQVPPVAERVDVARVVVDVHVLDDAGRPIMGLSSADVRLRVDGKPVPIEAFRWTTTAIIDRQANVPAAPVEAAGTTREPALPSGRLIVLFFQKDLEPSRLEGLAGMLRRAQTFVDGLRPDDWVAVLSFEHHLDVRMDFTRDRAAARDMLARQLLFASSPAPAPAVDGPTLVAGFDDAAGRRAASMEQALLVMARALDRVPGSKSVVLFGHGFGRILIGDMRSAIVGVDAEYREAARLLARARVTVYALDVTQADSHTLATGLEQVAADTGGFYLQTHEFPGLALTRLGDALTGRYELSFEKPALPPGEHSIRIELVGRKGRVLSRHSYVG